MTNVLRANDKKDTLKKERITDMRFFFRDREKQRGTGHKLAHVNASANART